MTPDYASPEQISGGLVTEQSDVYSLGVLLYELLTGERPNKYRDSMRSGEPLPPSRTEGGRGLARDLDAVVLMAMQPEPERRYASAAAFESDLRRFLDSRPVQARRGLWPRAAGLISRHAVAVTAAAILVAGAGVAISLRGRLGNSAPPQMVPVTSLPGSETQPLFFTGREEACLRMGRRERVESGPVHPVAGGQFRAPVHYGSGRGSEPGVVTGWKANRMVADGEQRHRRVRRRIWPAARTAR